MKSQLIQGKSPLAGAPAVGTALLALFLGSVIERAAEAPAAVTIVENHDSEWRIISPSPNKPGISWAVQELRKYLELMSDAKLRAAEQSQGGPAIVVGLRSDFSREEQSALPPPAKGYDGYAVVVRAGSSPTILIAGDNGHGAIYGVYDLLEHLGCRWFYPTQDSKDPEVVPRQTSLRLPASAWSIASPMKNRIYNGDGWFFDIDPARAIKQVDHAMKTRCNLIGWQCATDKPLMDQYRRLREQGVLAELEKRDLGLHGPAHSFNLLLPNDQFTNHPNWFGMRDGKRVPQSFLGAQFCWSNAEARKAFAKNVAAFAQEAPLIRILAIVPFDGGRACDCAECQKMGASNGLLAVMDEVINRVQARRPGLPVETVGGYGPVQDPPAGAKINPRQGIVWAHWGRYMAYGYDDARYDHRKNLEAWHAAAPGGLTVVQYYSDNFAEPWVPPPFATAIKGDRQYLLTHNIDSIYFLIYGVGYWWNHSLNTYLSARSFHDASLDPFDLIQDYALSYYGPEAGPLLGQYFDQWARDPDLAYHLRGGATRADRETLARQRAAMIEAAIRVTKDQPVYAYRVAKVAGLHKLAERLAEGIHSRHQIQWARHDGDFAEATKLLAAAEVYTDSIMGRFYDLADLNEGLIDKNEVPTFIKMNVKNWIDSESKAIAAQDKKVEDDEFLKDSDVSTEAR